MQMRILVCVDVTEQLSFARDAWIPDPPTPAKFANFTGAI